MLDHEVPLHLTTARSRQAPLVLCPGDPDRATLIARELLESAALVTRARGLLGYTGRFRGVPVTVQTTGMGGGSTAIVVHELVELGARVLVRAGSCGGIADGIAVGDLVVADPALAEDGVALALAGPGPTHPDPALAGALEAAAGAACGSARRGAVASTDLFYDPDPGRPARWRRAGVLAVEMEAATLYALAARAGVRAGCLLFVANLVPGGARTGPARYRELGLRTAEAALAALVSA
jgi:DeoD family purine-nucleoside phosphorylase